jgi:ribosomal protein S18 acetylase RimI-like enzyme
MIASASVEDLAGVLRVDPLAQRGDHDRAELLRASVRAGECLVFRQDAVVAGFVVIRRAHFFGRDFVELLVVVASLRRTGIGRKLLRAAVAGAASEQVFTSTNMSNHAMRSLLRKEGWSFCGGLTGLDEGDPELFFCTVR